MFKNLGHAILFKKGRKLFSGQWVYGLSHYVLGCGNAESIAQ